MSHLTCTTYDNFTLSSHLQQGPPLSSADSYYSAQDQAILREFFNQIDLQNSDKISHKDLTERIAMLGIKFHDKTAFHAFKNHPATQNETLNFQQFLDLLTNLRLSPGDLWKTTNFASTLHSPLKMSEHHIKLQKNCESGLDIHSQIKNKMIQKAVHEISNKRNEKFGFHQLKEFMESIGCDWGEEKILSVFKELDLNNKGELTLDDVIESCKTKKGDLSAYNIIIAAKMPKQENDTSSLLICLDNYTKNLNVKEEDVLDLIEAYQLFDAEGWGLIKSNIIQNQLDTFSSQLSQSEQKILEDLACSPSKQMKFADFFNQFMGTNQNISNITSLAQKFNQSWRHTKALETKKGKYASTIIMNEDKSSLSGTMDSLQSFSASRGVRGSLEEVLDPYLKKKQFSILSASDIENNRQNSQKKNNKNNTHDKISSIQDQIELDSLEIKDAMNLDLKGIPRSSVTDSTCEITPELKSSQKSIMDTKSKGPMNITCSLESLVEDGESADVTPLDQNFEEHEMIRNENLRMRKYIQEKENELTIIKENHSNAKADLEDDLAVKTSLISRMHKEQEAVKAHLELAKEEVEQLKIKMNDSAMKLKKANDETSTMKKKLAVKVKEALIQKEKYDAMERQYNDKTREIDSLLKKKTTEEKAYQENITGMKSKLTYLTQKFTEYLTQNTSLQSELHERNTAVKKMDTAFKDHIRRTDDQKQKLDLKINELEEQMSLKSRNICEKVEQATETDAICSPQVSRRQMEEKLMCAMTENQDLKKICDNYEVEAGRLKTDLQQRNNEVQKLQDAQEKSSQYLLTNHFKPNDIANTLIESLYTQLETIRNEKETLEVMLGVADTEVSNERVKNNDLTTKVKEYQLEFNYLNECLNESLLKNNGSNDSVILFAHEKNQDNQSQNQQVEGGEIIEKISDRDPRESLKSVQEYVGKLETLDQRTKRLDEEIETMNKKIETLKLQNDQEDDESSDKKEILIVYKKLIENKQLEIENLKKRVKGKAGLVSANMRLLSKLETLFTDKLNELSEVSQNQEILAVENNRLNLIIKEQNSELERFRKGQEETQEFNKTQRKISDANIKSEQGSNNGDSLKKK